MDEKIVQRLANGIVTVNSKSGKYSAYCTVNANCKGWEVNNLDSASVAADALKNHKC